jgi:hypothetical protein
MYRGVAVVAIERRSGSGLERIGAIEIDRINRVGSLPTEAGVVGIDEAELVAVAVLVDVVGRMLCIGMDVHAAIVAVASDVYVARSCVASLNACPDGSLPVRSMST